MRLLEAFSKPEGSRWKLGPHSDAIRFRTTLQPEECARNRGDSAAAILLRWINSPDRLKIEHWRFDMKIAEVTERRMSLLKWTTVALSMFHGLLVKSAAEINVTNLPVRALGSGMFQIGHVRMDKNQRSVSFPAIVNMREETIEYIVVHKTGKTHESVFRTDARPQDVHVAMLLLGAKSMMTNRFGEDGRALPEGEKVSMQARWTNSGAEVSCAVEDVVFNRDTKRPMTRGEWIYNGSNFAEGAFTAQRDGSIVSIHIDPDALINNPRPGRENDDLHEPNAPRLPVVGAPVELTIKLIARDRAAANEQRRGSSSPSE